MHPELETFFNHVFEPVQSISPEIGRVVIEPDYETTAPAHEAGHLVSELLQCIREQPLSPALQSRSGLEIDVPGEYRLLRKYIRRITLHGDPAPGPWIEVAPPGNWI